MKDAKIMIKFIILRIYLTIFLLTIENPKMPRCKWPIQFLKLTVSRIVPLMFYWFHSKWSWFDPVLGKLKHHPVPSQGLGFVKFAVCFNKQTLQRKAGPIF